MASPKTISRLDNLIWTLIFGGLFTVVLGLAARHSEQGVAVGLLVAGAIATAIGCVLVYVRSRMALDPAAAPEAKPADKTP